MTKKEIYYLSVRVTQAALKTYFDPSAFGDKYFQTPNGKKIVKKVYDTLEPVLLTPVVKEGA